MPSTFTCLALCHLWPEKKSCVHLDANKRVFLKGLLLEFIVVSRGRASTRALPDNRQGAAGTSLPGAHHKQPQASQAEHALSFARKLTLLADERKPICFLSEISTSGIRQEKGELMTWTGGMESGCPRYW